MKTITRSTHAIEIDGTEYELRLAPERGADIKHRKLDDGRIVIGYLLQDSDAPNPLEDCDGMGHIYSLSNRHNNSISHSEAILKLESNQWAVALSYFEHGQCKWGVSGTMSSMPDFNWDGVDFAGVWEPDLSAEEECERRACVYSIGHVSELSIMRGSGPKFLATVDKTNEQQRFNEWHEAFAWLRSKTKCKTWTKRGAQRAATELAAQACEQYTSWCNGDCWGVVCVTCEADGTMVNSGECWGYIGSEYAEQELTDQMAAQKA